MNAGPPPQRPLCSFSAAELVDGFRDGRFSPVDAVDACLAQVEALDGELHAFTEVFRDEARAAATDSARRYKAGRPLGPLDGVPVGVKDLVEIAGKACAAGSPSRRGVISERTAPVVTRLVDGGAIILGKTHTVEFALGGWGTNLHLGAPRNPWAPAKPYTAGGSSSGSVVAVAARMVPLAIGTDTGGSIRVPSGFNGLFGLKTTPGQISLEGVVPLSPSLDTIGPIARTVADAAAFYAALLDEGVSIDLSKLEDGVAGLTLAAVEDRELDQVDLEIVQAYENSLRDLERLGARIEVVAMPRRLYEFQRDSEIMMAEAFAHHGHLAEDASSVMDPGVRARLMTGSIPARSYIQAKQRAEADARAITAALAGFHALLTPTARTLPIPLDEVDEAVTPATLARFVNQIGFCGLAAPNGLSRGGLPTALQIVCRPNEEAMALRIGRACERLDPLGGAIPPMARLG